LEKLTFAQWLNEIERLLNGANSADIDYQWLDAYHAEYTPVEAVLDSQHDSVLAEFAFEGLQEQANYQVV
jgi:hypothetical protein